MAESGNLGRERGLAPTHDKGNSMGELTVNIEGRQAVYLPANELIDSKRRVANLDELEDRRLAGHTRLRRILIKLMPNWPLACFYLHWSDGTNLDTLATQTASRADQE